MNAAPTAETKTHNETLTLSDTEPTRSGYEFLGWATDSSATTAKYLSGATFTRNADTILYAVWLNETQTTTYTLSIYPSGGGTWSDTGGTTSRTFSGTAGSNVYLPEITKAGTVTCTYDGNGGTINGSSTYSVDLPYSTYTFSPSYGTYYISTKMYKFGSGSCGPYGVTPCAYMTPSECPYTPVRDGYTFKGWASTTNATTGIVGTTATSPRTLYAVWTQN